MARGRLKGIKKPHPLGSLPSRSGVSLLTAESGITTSILPGVRISGLPVAGAATETDQLEVNQGGASRRITIDQLLDVTDGAYLALAGGTLTGPLAGTTAAFSAAPAYPNDSTSVATTAFVMDALAGGGGGPPSGVAGGDLAGTYPNPTAIKASGAFAVTGALTGTTATMSGAITSTGATITAQGGAVIVDRAGDAAQGVFDARVDAGQNAGVILRTGTSTRWQIIKQGTAEGGANAGSNFTIVAHDDAGAALSTPVQIIRSTGAVTLTGALTGTSATMSGNIISTGGSISAQGGSVFVDRTGDAAAATTEIRADAGQVATVIYRTGGTERWQIRKNSVAEGGSNAGSDLEIIARTDAGGALSTPLTITRSTGAVTLTGALTGTTAAFSGEVTAATPTYPDNDTSVATTAYVTAAIAAAPAAVAPLNRLHNAALLVCDKGPGPFSTGVAGYGHGYNRWATRATGAAASWARVRAGKGFASQYTGIASNTGVWLAQGLEAGDCLDLVSQAMVLSAVVSSSHLTTMSWRVSYCNVADAFAARTQIATGSFAMTTTPTLQSATFNAGANAQNGLIIEFFIAALVAARTWTVREPQLTTGSTATTFVPRRVADDVAECRRYYQASGNNWTGVYMSAGNPGGMATRDTFPFSPPLFRSPDMAYTGQGPSTVFFADYIAWSGEWNTTAPNPDGRYLFGYTAEAEPVL